MEYVPKSWRSKKQPKDWAALVLKHRDACLKAEVEEVQARFVEAVKDHPLYGTCFFHVKKHRFPSQMDSFPTHCVIALNSEGLHFLGAEERDTLSSFGYADIYRWGGSSTQFSIIIWNPETEDTDDVAMFTCQAADMAALILDYINSIMVRMGCACVFAPWGVRVCARAREQAVDSSVVGNDTLAHFSTLPPQATTES